MRATPRRIAISATQLVRQPRQEIVSQLVGLLRPLACFTFAFDRPMQVRVELVIAQGEGRGIGHRLQYVLLLKAGFVRLRPIGANRSDGIVRTNRHHRQTLQGRGGNPAPPASLPPGPIARSLYTYTDHSQVTVLPANLGLRQVWTESAATAYVP